MEAITHQVRRQQWAKLIQECLASGLNKTEWCRQNGISDKKFFYWQKILRREAYDLTACSGGAGSLVAVPSDPAPVTPFIELKLNSQPAETFDSSKFRPDAVIQADGFVIGLSNTASAELIRSLGGLLHVQ